MPEPRIRTPDQRLRVFVSSTLGELAAERAAAREAIERLRLTPVMFELGARPHPPRALYRAYLEQSDVFIGVYGERYGWIAPGEEISGLEDEYRLSGDRPRLLYLREPAPGREARLEAMLERIRTDDRASYRHFADPAELAELIADDLAVLMTERFADASVRRSEPLPTGRHPVPRSLTRLIGRDAEVDRVTGLVTDGGRRLITLTGPGGIGKTRIALAVADRLSNRFADGVAYVSLAGLDEPSLLVPTIAEAVGIHEGRGIGIGIALREALADREMLIVLDNLEQLADAAPSLVDLLAGAPGLHLLVTSRTVLNLGGEQVVDVPPLDEPVAMFVDRMTALDPAYEPSAEDLAAFDELGRRLDALPLAIELACAQLRTLRPRALLERLGDRPLARLTGGARDLPARQQTLQRTIAWSHDLLDAEARQLFDRMSVFVGGASLDAIERVADPDAQLDVLALLGRLVEHSLVRPVGEASEPRFTMLRTIREFAVARLEERGEAQAVRARHSAYFGAMAAASMDGIGTSAQLEWIDRLALEADNMRAVLRRAIRAGDASIAARLGAALSAYWQMRSQFTEGRGWMAAVQAMPTASPHDRAIAWTSGGMLAFWQGDFEPVEVGIDEAIAALRAAGDSRALGFAEILRAVVSGAAADVDTARAALDASTHAFETHADPFLRSIGLLSRAYLARMGGDAASGWRLALEALSLSKDAGEFYVRSVASTILASIALDAGKTADVRLHALDALRAAQVVRNLATAGYALELWAAAELADRRAERAARLYALAIAAWGLASARPWRTEQALHDRLVRELDAALDGGLSRYVDEAEGLDLDDAITELVTSQPE